MIRRRIYTKYFFPIYVPVVLICIIITAIFYPQIANGIFYVLPLFLLLLLFSFFIPGGNQPLGSREKNIPNIFVWILAWLGLQISLAVILAGAMYIVSDALNIQPGQENIPFNFIQSGFYPWSLCLLLGVIAARFVPYDNHAMPFRIPLSVSFRSTVDGMWGAGADLSLKHGLYIASALTCAIYLGKLIQPLISSDFEISIETLLFCTIIYLFLASSYWQQFLHYYCEKKIPQFMFFNILGVLIFAVAVLFNLGHKIVVLYSHMQPHQSTITLFNMTNPAALWKLFYIVLATLWGLQLARVIKYLCQGYSLLSVLVTALFLPICVAIIVGIDRFALHQHLTILFNSIHLKNDVMIIFLVLGFVLSGLFFKDPRTLRLIHLANLTKRDKMISLPTARTVSMLMTSVFLLYLFGGLSWMMIVIAGVTIPIFAMIVLIILGAFSSRRILYRLKSDLAA